MDYEDIQQESFENQPVVVQEQVDAEPCAQQEVATEPPKPRGFKRLIRKWWFWLIVGVVVMSIVITCVIGVLVVVGVIAGNSTDSGSHQTYTNPYVTMVKTTTHSSYGVTYGVAFERFFSNTSWSHFVASTGENVVEFEGDFQYGGANATATIQFIVDTSEGTITTHHLSIDGVSQSRLTLAVLIKTVFESY